MTSLLILPHQILGHIYKLLDNPSDRRNFFHTCKTLHEAEDITQHVRALTVSYDVLASSEESMPIVLAKMTADRVARFPATPRLRILSMTDFTSDGIRRTFAAFCEKRSRALDVLANVQTLRLMGCSIATNELGEALAPAVRLMLPELQHLEFGIGSDPYAYNCLAPSFLSPDQHDYGVGSFASNLSTLTLEGTTVTSMDSLLRNIGGMSQLKHLVLDDITVSENLVDIEELPQRVCDLAPLVHLQSLEKLKLVGPGDTVNLDAVLQACGKLSELELCCFEMSEPLRAGSASVTKIKLGANFLHELAENIDMSLFPSLKSVKFGITNTSKTGRPVPVEDAGQHLLRLHSAATKIATWPVTSWQRLMFSGLDRGSLEQQAQFTSDLLHALSPLKGSRAAACLEGLDLEGRAQLQSFPTSFITALADMFPNISHVVLRYESLDTRSVMDVLKAHLHMNRLQIISNPGAFGLSEGIVAACVAACLTSRPTNFLDVTVGGNHALRGCQAAWNVFCDACPDAGSCAVSLTYDEEEEEEDD